MARTSLLTMVLACEMVRGTAQLSQHVPPGSPRAAQFASYPLAAHPPPTQSAAIPAEPGQTRVVFGQAAQEAQANMWKNRGYGSNDSDSAGGSSLRGSPARTYANVSLDEVHDQMCESSSSWQSNTG